MAANSGLSARGDGAASSEAHNPCVTRSVLLNTKQCSGGNAAATRKGEIMGDRELIKHLSNMKTNADLSGNDWESKILGQAIARLEVISNLPSDDGIWSYYRQEMWGHGRD